MKEQDKTSQKELNKVEANKLPDTELKTTVIRKLSELRKRIYVLSLTCKKK